MRSCMVFEENWSSDSEELLVSPFRRKFGGEYVEREVFSEIFSPNPERIPRVDKRFRTRPKTLRPWAKTYLWG